MARLQVDVDPAGLGASASAVAALLSARQPRIIVRAHEVELGNFQLYPCNLLEGQAEEVAIALREPLTDGALLASARSDDAASRNGYLKWGTV
ncbi:hypothetical protein [Rhodobium gokarnense]|uniref:Uncharacterized protein n=1 Tax=Rhodobium gokarnense TaxID=364296 RepID=A0ABT3HEV6_9HYPH|nr:hypothetical protein [Rhodobium gokarnense]MCW2308879.1 hypothetical protein [Rhodobium gokarnense]